MKANKRTVKWEAKSDPSYAMKSKGIQYSIKHGLWVGARLLTASHCCAPKYTFGLDLDEIYLHANTVMVRGNLVNSFLITSNCDLKHFTGSI